MAFAVLILSHENWKYYFSLDSISTGFALYLQNYAAFSFKLLRFFHYVSPNAGAEFYRSCVISLNVRDDTVHII